MLSVVCWLWQGHDPRRVFLPEHVNTMARMYRRHLKIEHQVVCVCESGEGFDEGVKWVKMPDAAVELRQIPSPEGSPRFPTCYPRLWNWSREARRVFGERILAIDIDHVLLADISDLVTLRHTLVGERPQMKWGNPQRIAGGMYLLTTGAHPEVWEGFRGGDSIKEARLAGFRGSDQAWISYRVGASAHLWPKNCGLYSVRDFLDTNAPLPADARLVQFNGPRKPWDCMHLDWVSANWR